MFGPKVNISAALMEKLKVAAGIAGASSVDELVTQLLETEANRIIASTGKKKLRLKKLKILQTN